MREKNNETEKHNEFGKVLVARNLSAIQTNTFYFSESLSAPQPHDLLWFAGKLAGGLAAYMVAHLLFCLCPCLLLFFFCFCFLWAMRPSVGLVLRVAHSDTTFAYSELYTVIAGLRS